MFPHPWEKNTSALTLTRWTYFLGVCINSGLSIGVSTGSSFPCRIFVPPPIETTFDSFEDNFSPREFRRLSTAGTCVWSGEEAGSGVS